jgi:hypothetical protein
MKEKIIEIIGFGMELERAELKAKELIILFNFHLLEKANESYTLTELLEKTFINI